MNYRKGEPEKSYFRADRFFCIDNSWFFSTREGSDVGPFDRKGEAQAERLLFIRHINEGGIMAASDFQNHQKSLLSEAL